MIHQTYLTTKARYSLVFILFIGLGISNSFGQQATVASGGDGSGVSGTLSYSLGQISYTTIQDSGGNLALGVQQTFYACLGDFNFDGMINTSDLLILLTEYDQCVGFCLTDLNNDLIINTGDLLIFLTVYDTDCSI